MRNSVGPLIGGVPAGALHEGVELGTVQGFEVGILVHPIRCVEPRIDRLTKPAQSLGCVALHGLEARQVVKSRRRDRVVVTEHSPPGLQDFEIQRLGLFVASQVLVQKCQVVSSAERFRVVVTVYSFLALGALKEQRLCL